MKHFYYYIVFFIISGSNLFAQIPAGYYDNAIGYTGEDLKTALYNIIKGHTIYPYTSSSTDVWDILKETDKDTVNPDNVILVYTGWSVNAAQEYNNGNGWSREHCWPKSHGFPDEWQPPFTDIHHLKPIDVSVNSARNNRWYAECDSVYYDGTIPTDSWTSYTQWVWKPRDLAKGDCARAMFYMATRYEGDYNPAAGVTEPDLELIDSIQQDDNSPLPLMSLLSDLLLWHVQDTVDAFELNRNNVIYTYQGNRNPFIDHPEYVCMIFGSDCPVTEVPEMISAEGVSPNRIDVSWVGNSDPDPVLVAWNYENVFGIPKGRYTIGDPVEGGGTVLYTGSESTCSHTGVLQQTYYYKIWSLDSVIAYSEGIETSASPLPPNSIYNPFDRLLVYPNPCREVCHIDIPMDMQLVISDINGKTMFAEYFQKGHHLIDTGSYLPGIYIVKMIGDEMVFTKRVLVL